MSSLTFLGWMVDFRNDNINAYVRVGNCDISGGVIYGIMTKSSVEARDNLFLSHHLVFSLKISEKCRNCEKRTF